MNIIEQHIREVLAKVPNVSDPYFSDDVVLKIIEDAGFKKYVEDYNRVSMGMDEDNQGSYGFWTKQQAGFGVTNPIIFYNEIYSFANGGNVWTCVVSWRYNVSGEITNNTCVTEFNGDSAAKIINKFKGNVMLSNGYVVAGEYDSYKLAKDAADKDVNKFKKDLKDI